MVYKGTLIAVADMERSKAFYCGLLQMKVAADFGANVQLDGGLFLQTVSVWRGFIGNRSVTTGHNAAELYFETDDFDGFIARLEKTDVEYIHAPLEHDWGQRAVRFYDPERNIIEVAETLTMVVRRFIKHGMNEQQVAKRMDVPEEYVRGCMEEIIP